jgi:hypothetical protein
VSDGGFALEVVGDGALFAVAPGVP